MSHRKVLLVHPPSAAEWRGLVPHLGQAYLAQTLQENGIEYAVLDMNLGYKTKHLLREIREFQPDLLGISLISMEYKRYYRIMEEVKKSYPRLKIVAGGPHVTILKEKVLEECPAIDYGVTFEGEGTLLDLARDDVPEKDIRGLIFRAGGPVNYNGDREFNLDLDTIPWPRYEKFEMGRYVPEITIYSSRGCPHQCIFCPNKLISPFFRPRSPTHVADEMEYWYKKGYRQFNFDDDNFNLLRERIFRICDEIEKRGLKGLTLRCSNGIRADRVDRKMLARMRQIGFKYIAFGADAGNNRMLEIIRKGEKIEDIEQAMKDATELGYETKLLFVVGTPYETREDVEDKVRLTRKFPVQEVHFYNLIPYPGTELFDWVTKNQYFLIQPEEYLNTCSSLTKTPVFETPELPQKVRLELFHYLEGVRKQVHREAIQRIFHQRNFLGASASYVLSSSLMENLFYHNATLRKIIDGIRYKQA
jgi:anaerobic magnesium-protoporphyrin IX monomethyl ester cyclase